MVIQFIKIVILSDEWLGPHIILRVLTPEAATPRPQLNVTNVGHIKGCSDKSSIIHAFQILSLDYIRASARYHHVMMVLSNDST